MRDVSRPTAVAGRNPTTALSRALIRRSVEQCRALRPSTDASPPLVDRAGRSASSPGLEAPPAPVGAPSKWPMCRAERSQTNPRGQSGRVRPLSIHQAGLLGGQMAAGPKIEHRPACGERRQLPIAGGGNAGIPSDARCRFGSHWRGRGAEAPGALPRGVPADVAMTQRRPAKSASRRNKPLGVGYRYVGRVSSVLQPTAAD